MFLTNLQSKGVISLSAVHGWLLSSQAQRHLGRQDNWSDVSLAKKGASCDTSFSVGSLNAARRAAGAVMVAVDRVLRGRNRYFFRLACSSLHAICSCLTATYPHFLRTGLVCLLLKWTGGFSFACWLLAEMLFVWYDRQGIMQGFKDSWQRRVHMDFAYSTT